MYNWAMGKFITRIGMCDGRLSVVADAGVNANKKRLWRCLCDCGKEVVIPSGSLATGNTQSCGCYHLEKITRHGGWNRSSYNTWRAMIRRCQNPKDKDYVRYGARGIIVCPEWQEYVQFVFDMGEPGEGQTLDRIENSLGYFKNNCRWASGHVQSVNSRRKTSVTGHRGVVYLPAYQKWLANITAQGRRYYSSVCVTLEDAVAARRQLELVHWESQT
jgi:hypothetical protein